MLDGPSVVAALKECGITHVIWIPDSELGTWEPALRAEPDLQLIRVCREGEAIAVAAGLLLGGKRPVVLIQCTGLFEAGDALRNVVHDLKLPLFLVVGLRSYYAYQQGGTRDTCPVFAEPFLSGVIPRGHNPSRSTGNPRPTPGRADCHYDNGFDQLLAATVRHAA